MQTGEDTWRQAIQDKEAASVAVVEAERALHRQLQHHRAGSPTVDDAVSDLDLRRTEYAAAVHATDEAADVYYRAAAASASRAAARRCHQSIGGQAFILKLQRKWLAPEAYQALESWTTVEWSSNRDYWK
ncbi:hypothetical protein PF004_g29117 [Phytophthora fragariae]|uniref:Uncharacterized protein n=2 Tax=Phytophthora fragariae TaxID=53985 RepID=A0A6G0MH05_9STRA|nr:hypothetical protein PF004_g29117 [Phytophthora fragariae]